MAVMASRFKLALAAGGRKAALERQALDSTLHLKGGMKMVFVPRRLHRLLQPLVGWRRPSCGRSCGLTAQLRALVWAG